MVAEPVMKAENKKEWLSEQEDRLFADNVEAICDELNKLSPKHRSRKKDFIREANYFSKHAERMRYGSFRKKGYLIGSGPIESAHRKVLQQRLKPKMDQTRTAIYSQSTSHLFKWRMAMPENLININ